MKTIILIIASFLCVNLFAQHQAQFDEETPHTKVFKEVFNNSYETRQNGGTITDVTFSNGEAAYNGTTSQITFNKPIQNNTYTVRLKYNQIAFSGSDVPIDFRGAGSEVGYIVTDPTGIVVPSSGTVYINGSAGSAISLGDNDLVVAGMTLNTNEIYVGANYIQNAFMEAEFDLVEIYEGTLTAEEVYNLYHNKRYEELNVTPILEVTAERGVIESDSSFVNTGVDVVRDGSIWVMDFDGVSDYIESVDNILGDEDFTISFWVYSDKINKEDVYLFGEYEDSDNRWYIRLRANLGLQLYSEVGGVPATNTDFTTLNTEPDTWNYIGLSISRSDSMYYKYLNGELVHSAKGSSDFTLDLDNAGKFEIGRYTSSTYGKMKLSDFKIDDVVWTDEEFSQYYTSTKRKYGK